MASSRRRSKWDITSPDDEKTSSGFLSATDAARERAAKLNAMLAAQGKLAKGIPPPPVVAQPPPAPSAPSGPPKPLNNSANNMLNQDLFTAEVEINDSPARVTLCRGITQDEINRYSGAAVSTKGKFMTEKEKCEMEQTGCRPLYLSIQGLTQEKVDLAVKRVRQIMNGADIYGNPPAHQVPVQPQRMPVPPHMATPSFNQPPPVFDRQPLPPGMHYVQDKVFVGLDNAVPEFNVKEKLVGPGGSYFQHITTQTGAKVQLRGKGSGFIEPTSGKEAFEALYIYISHGKFEGLSAAKKLVENLLETVHTEYKAFEQTRRSHYGYSPYMNACNQVNVAQPPSGYQPPLYGYPYHPPPGSGYPQSLPAPGFHYGHPHAMPGQLPPHPSPAGVPRGPPPYGPPLPVTGYPSEPRSMAPPVSGPVSYHSHPPTPQYQGLPPHGQPLPGPQPAQHPSHVPAQPPLPDGPPAPAAPAAHDPVFSPSRRSQVNSVEASPQPQYPPRRKFTEKVPVKPSAQESANGVKHQESSISNPSIGQASATARETGTKPLGDMPPPIAPPVIKAKPREQDAVRSSPSPRKDAMSPPTLLAHGRGGGKRDAPMFSKSSVPGKKQKTEGNPVAKPLAIGSLVAYGGGDSSDEEGSQSPDDKQEEAQKKNSASSRQFQGAKLPFWAVRH